MIIDAGPVDIDRTGYVIEIHEVIYSIYKWNNIASLSTCILENLVSTGNPVPHMFYNKVMSPFIVSISSTIKTLQHQATSINIQW